MSDDLDDLLGTSSSVKRDGDTVTVSLSPSENPELGDYDKLLRERGLDPSEWTVVSVKANEWDAMAGQVDGQANQVVRMRQWTITLRPAVHKILVSPAVHVPPVKRSKVGPAASEKPETILVEGDHQVPYHDPRLHEASLLMLKDLVKKHRLTEHVFLGDTGDFPTISKHADHPAATATPQEVVQQTYDLLREKAEAAPNLRRRKLKGNHDWRIEAEQLARAERIYGLAPAQKWEDTIPEIPALHLSRLLHLEELGIELVEDPRGWEHAEIELVSGPKGLVVRHGWLTGANTVKKSVEARGRSIIVGHIHRDEQVRYWDPSSECYRTGVVCPSMCLSRDKRFPHYAVLDRFVQGCVVVTRWPDGDFRVEPVAWSGDALRWRSESWFPSEQAVAA